MKFNIKYTSYYYQEIDLSNILLNSNRKKVVFSTCKIETLDKETGEKSVKKVLKMQCSSRNCVTPDL